MGMYTQSQGYDMSADTSAVDVNMDELLEAFFYDEFGSVSDSAKKTFIQENATFIEEGKGRVSKKTIVRLNKNDDLSRRTTMAALQIARDKNDPLWQKLVSNRVLERKLLASISKKYGAKAGIVAKVAQREYLSGDTRARMLSAKDISHRA